MILPNVRASFGREEAAFLLNSLARRERRPGETEDRLRDEGFDAVLDDPRTLGAVIDAGGISAAPARLVFYLLVRHALLEEGLRDRTLADYVAAMLLEFGRLGTVPRHDEGPDDSSFDYLADVVHAIAASRGRQAFLLRAHLGNFALWLSGLFPDRITARVQRRGAPGIAYYETLGATGYRLAAGSADAGAYGLDDLFRTCADSFPALRITLNRISDRHFFPGGGDPLERVLRQVADRFRSDGEPN